MSNFNKLRVRVTTSLAFFLLIFSSLAFSQTTGDPEIDSWLSTYSLKAGNAAAPTSLIPSLYTGGVEACQSASALPHEARCPSDLLYTPNANTGGYQAFGIGAEPVTGGTYVFADCYVVYIWNPSLEYYEAYIQCSYYTLTVPDYTWGIAAAKISFGTNQMQTSWGFFPMSTMAFKANRDYLPSVAAVDCNPVFSFLTLSTPCDFLKSDTYAVPDSGYEDKIIMTDRGCATPTFFRSGDANDATYGCFTHSTLNWATDLPGAYRDTTYLDSPGDYQPAVGTTVPFLLVGGNTYRWWSNFIQLGHEPASGSAYVLRHNAAVTHFDPILPSCSLVSAPELCYYNVDQTMIAPSIIIP